MGKKTRRRLIYVAFILPSIVVTGFVAIYPMFFAGYLSLRFYYFLNPATSKFIGLMNYKDLFLDPVIWHSISVTLIYVGATVTIELIFGFGMALLFLGEIKGTSVYRSLLIIPMTLTPVVAGLIWKYLLMEGFGAWYWFFARLGFESKWYGNPSIALPVMILIDVWESTPFMFLILFSGLLGLPVEPYESAKIDGASRWQSFVHLTVPMLQPVIVIAILLRMIDAIRVFDVIWVLTRGGPARATEVISVHTFLESFKYFNMGYSSALSIMVILMSVGLTVFFIKGSRVKL